MKGGELAVEALIDMAAQGRHLPAQGVQLLAQLCQLPGHSAVTVCRPAHGRPPVIVRRRPVPGAETAGSRMLMSVCLFMS